MARKGTSIIFFAFMAVFVVVGAIVSTFTFQQYANTLEKKSTTHSLSFAHATELREEVLNAQCITRDRAVFYKSKIDNNPDALRCIGSPEEPFSIIFEWTDHNGPTLARNQQRIVYYKITPKGSGNPSDVTQNPLDVSLDDLLDRFTTQEKYPIVIYDSDTGQYQQGIVFIGM